METQADFYGECLAVNTSGKAFGILSRCHVLSPLADVHSRVLLPLLHMHGRPRPLVCVGARCKGEGAAGADGIDPHGNTANRGFAVVCSQAPTDREQKGDVTSPYCARSTR